MLGSGGVGEGGGLEKVPSGCAVLWDSRSCARPKCQQLSQGCLRHWAAVARRSGRKSNIRSRKLAKRDASLRGKWYFSTSTSYKLHGRRTLIRCRSPTATHTHTHKEMSWFKTYTKRDSKTLLFESFLNTVIHNNKATFHSMLKKSSEYNMGFIESWRSLRCI